jgi:hypothetical protein
LYYLRDRFGKKARVKGSKKFLTEKQMEAMVSGEEIPEPTPEEIEELETAAGEDLEEEAVASEASSEPAEEKEEAKKED